MTATLETARVTLLAHALPVDVAERLADRAGWLRRQLPALDQEMAVACPPIAIVPACWFTTIGGQDVLVGGRLSARELDGQFQFIVEITAPTLLDYDDGFVLGVIAHEFLHVVEATVQQNRADRLRDWFGVQVSRPDLAAYGSSWHDYRRLDRGLQAPPALWLSERLQRLQARVEGEPQDDAAARVRQHWLARWLPYETLASDGRLNVGSMWLDPAILARQDALMVSAARQRQ